MMPNAPEQNFVFLTTAFHHKVISDAAAKRGMLPDEYVSWVITKQLTEDGELPDEIKAAQAAMEDAR